MPATRRDFIKQSSLLAACFFVDKEELFKKKKPVGVQLYTLRNEIGKDAKGTLEKVAQLGYKQVETFGYGGRKWFGLSPAELSSVLKNNGLTSPSGHTFPGSFFLKDGWEDQWKVAVEDSKTLGQEYITIPWLEENYRNSADNYRKIAAGLNKAGELAHQGGMKLAYHNHDFEFFKVDGTTGFDILTKETDKKLVQFELDLYWAVKAGHDPVQLFAAHPGRIVMWHVKDMDKTEKKFFTEVGNGTIDFKKIFAAAKKSGMKYFFVEQDVCPGSPFDSIAKSISYLNSNIL
ncbi:sugar phosphate isomerase/epimerase [Paraflavitalea sp. CAU 1676]|uniref:sugar phosphate isomerase/epimerase family protein n=1 Tax=Paraflavitalea sp. CAU 1676 TaxID=3032598 RepID=UPI0023DBCFF1|nr:sugar phosphate isomerase/epimerase [Paraflavitalea sp. CAU 1676]MDF2191167.1 sugar phosphate isomerase/epimerase [Paraflavitalea sp. CAU 1676]